jgi:hypothetical protein
MHVIVVEADDRKTAGLQPLGTSDIVRRLVFSGVRVAVNLDNQPRRGAIEIGNEAPNGMLATQLVAKLVPSHSSPDLLLSRGHRMPELTCAGQQDRVNP